MKADDIRKLQPLVRMLTAKDHRNLGTELRKTDRVLRGYHRRSLGAASLAESNGEDGEAVRYFAQMCDVMSDFRHLLDEAWLVSVGNGCAGEEHSPYYGHRWCSHCSGLKDGEVGE